MMQTETIVSPPAAVERLWYYVREDKSEGPIPESEMLKMLADGHVGANTLVWTESMTDWTPAAGLEVFCRHLASFAPVVAQPVLTLRQRAQAARAEGVPQVRPWVRCLARWSDLTAWAVVVGLLSHHIRVIAELPPFALELMAPFVWVFVEAFLLATWGRTPGKWLYGTWVVDETGHRLSFSNALSRSFSVWFIGLGCYLPIIVFVTLIVSYVRLRKEGVTPWDREGRFVVIHERIGAPRITLAVFAALILVGLILLGHWAQIQTV